MMSSMSSGSQGYFTDDVASSTLESLNIPISHYNSELIKLRDTDLEFSESLKWNHITNSNLDDLSRILFKNGIRIDELEVEISRSREDIILLKRDNRVVMKQLNIFFPIARRLYNNISQLYWNYDIEKDMHRKMLPLLECNEEEIDVDFYNC